MTKKDKLHLLSQLIIFANVDHKLDTMEYKFLIIVAKQMNISELEVNQLFENPLPYKPMKEETDRIVQFHRLVLLMNVDQKVTNEELIKIREFGVKMGLHPLAIHQVLKTMEKYENGIIPPDVLLDIFKTYYN